MIGYCFVRGVSCRSLFSCGDHERAYSGRVRNPENLLRCLFIRRKSSPSFSNCDLNREGGQKDAFLSSWCLVSPKWGCNRVISASRLSKPVLPIQYNSLWRIWARDLLRQVKALCWIRMVLFHKSRYSQASSYPRFAAFSGSAPFLI